MIFVQSEATAARRRFPIYLVDATDGITPETGEAGGQPQISKAGGAWTNTAATLTALGNGAYYVELTATELNTLGGIQVRYKSAATAEFNAPGVVVAIPVHVAVGAAGGIAGATDLSTALSRIGIPGIGESVLERLGLIKAKTDLLTFTGGNLHARVEAWNLAGITTNITGNFTGNLSGSVGSVTGAVGSVTGNVGGNVVGSVASVTGAVGSISGITFPSNFSALGINASGHISRVVLVDALAAAEREALALAIEAELANDATGAELKQLIAAKIIENLPDLEDLTLEAIAVAVRDEILDRVLAGNHEVEGSVGDRIRRLPNNPASAEAVGQAEMNLGTMLLDLRDYGDAEWATPAAVVTLATRALTMLEADGSNWRFTTGALFNAPAGGGGGGSSPFTTGDAEQIRFRLQIDGTKTEPTASTGDPITIAPATSADLCNVGTIVYGADNEPLEGAKLRYRLISAPGLPGIFPGTEQESEPAGEGGQVVIECWRGAVYEFWSGTGDPLTITIPDASTLAIGPIIAR